MISCNGYNHGPSHTRPKYEGDPFTRESQNHHVSVPNDRWHPAIPRSCVIGLLCMYFEYAKESGLSWVWHDTLDSPSLTASPDRQTLCQVKVKIKQFTKPFKQRRLPFFEKTNTHGMPWKLGNRTVTHLCSFMAPQVALKCAYILFSCWTVI